MDISGRNQLTGKVINTVPGTVTAEVEIDIGAGNKVTGVISKKSLDELQIKPGDQLTALIKATSVMFIKG
ncbi:MAG: TOBE domain-containing protein [Dethiobacteria bacterium]|jgi:molybdopterin-binding protein